jgi:DNA-directed RNA polymerase specialized sigma24 family protein
MNEEEIIRGLCSTASAQKEAVRALLSTKGKEFKYRFKYKGVPNDLCEDLLQEVLIKIIKGASSFDGTGGFTENSASVWMNRIAQNCLNDYFRINLKTIKLSTTEIKLNVGSIDDEAWMKSNSGIHGNLTNEHLLHKSENEIYRQYELRNQEISLEECIGDGFEEFASDEPDRARALTMQMDGESIESIAKRINRTVRASAEYLSQCRKKLKPYIENCSNLY